MSRYIDAEILKAEFYLHYGEGVDAFARLIDKQPTVNVAPMEEVERLQAEKETLEIYYKDYKYKNKELMAFNRRWAKECAELQDECDQIKAGTVREMQDRLDKHFCHDPAFLGVEQRLIMDIIDQIAKEMLEG